MTNSEDIYNVAHDQDANVVGASVNPPTTTGHVVTRGDGIVVDLSTANGLPPNANAVTAVMGADVSAAAVAARAAVRVRAFAADQAAVSAPIPAVVRGVLLTAVDEINTLRQWITGLKAAVAAAASLADLKTRVAALPDLANRTAAQAKNAVLAQINSGGAD